MSLLSILALLPPSSTQVYQHYHHLWHWWVSSPSWPYFLHLLHKCINIIIISDTGESPLHSGLTSSIFYTSVSTLSSSLTLVSLLSILALLPPSSTQVYQHYHHLWHWWVSSPSWPYFLHLLHKCINIIIISDTGESPLHPGLTSSIFYTSVSTLSSSLTLVSLLSILALLPPSSTQVYQHYHHLWHWWVSSPSWPYFLHLLHKCINIIIISDTGESPLHPGLTSSIFYTSVSTLSSSLTLVSLLSILALLPSSSTQVYQHYHHLWHWWVSSPSWPYFLHLLHKCINIIIISDTGESPLHPGLTSSIFYTCSHFSRVLRIIINFHDSVEIYFVISLITFFTTLPFKKDPPCNEDMSFDIYYVFNYDTWRAIGGRHILPMTPNDDVEADSASLSRLAESVHVPFKAAVSM